MVMSMASSAMTQEAFAALDLSDTLEVTGLQYHRTKSTKNILTYFLFLCTILIQGRNTSPPKI